MVLTKEVTVPRSAPKLSCILCYYIIAINTLLTCQVFKINVLNDSAKVYIRLCDRNGLDGNWLRGESHG